MHSRTVNSDQDEKKTVEFSMMIVSASSISALECVKLSTANCATVTFNSYGGNTAHLQVLPTVSGRICPVLGRCTVCVRGCMFPVSEE